jgi:chromate transporter
VALAWLAPVAILLIALGPENVFARLAVFFSQMAVLTFGGAYAVLAWVAQEAVQNQGWLSAGEMLDGLGMAETTPGPLIQVVQFVGFLAAFREAGGMSPYLAGVLGAVLVTWVTFTPSFLWIFLGAPWIERLRGNSLLAGALAAITAAVVGVIANLALWFALHVIFAEVSIREGAGLRVSLPVWSSLDPVALILTVVALVAVFRFRAGMGIVIGGSALLGLAARMLTGA